MVHHIYTTATPFDLKCESYNYVYFLVGTFLKITSSQPVSSVVLSSSRHIIDMNSRVKCGAQVLIHMTDPLGLDQ